MRAPTGLTYWNEAESGCRKVNDETVALSVTIYKVCYVEAGEDEGK